MIVRLCKDKVQLVIFCGLVLSGVWFLSGLFSSYTKWLGLAAYLGPMFGTIAIVVYISKLSWAFVENTAQEFWSDLCLVNMGLTLIGSVLFLVEIKEILPTIFLWAGVIGASVSWLFYKSGATHSRIALLIVHLLLPILLYVDYLIEGISPAAYYLPNGAGTVFAIATTLILMPVIMNALPTHSPPRLENNAMGTG